MKRDMLPFRLVTFLVEGLLEVDDHLWPGRESSPHRSPGSAEPIVDLVVHRLVDPGLCDGTLGF